MGDSITSVPKRLYHFLQLIITYPYRCQITTIGRAIQQEVSIIRSSNFCEKYIADLVIFVSEIREEVFFKEIPDYWIKIGWHACPDFVGCYYWWW